MTVPDATPADAPTVADAKVPIWAFDVVRLGVSIVAGVVVAAAVILITASVDPDPRTPWTVVGLFSFSAGSSAAYVIHTLAAFIGADGPTLHAWLIGSTPRGRFGRFGATLSGTGPTITVQWSVIAVAAVLVFTIFPSLLQRPLTVWLSVLVVASSWTVTLLAYAVHYARMDAVTGGLAFPDDGAHVFRDYTYLAVQVQTTFSTSDVSLMTTQARSIVTGHTLVSFAFNTVIIAMLITVLFLGAGGAS